MFNPAVHRLRGLCRVSVVSLIALATTGQAFAGSNTTSPAPTPSTPPAVLTTNPQVVFAGDASCAQQLTTIGLVAEGTGIGIDAAGTAADIVAQAIPPPGQEIAEAASLATQVAGLGVQAGALANEIVASTLPNCDAEFTGTVSVDAGGVNVTGGSIFNGDVGVNGNVNVSGSVNASQVNATQGISADGGHIWLGDTNGTTYSDGITLGGGALSGAGYGGLEATTGDVSAIAIGNGASAFSVNSVALGTGATAGSSGGGGPNATAVGANASAPFSNSAAFGNNATATLINQQVFGTSTNSYTMPGITSAQSRSRQSGLLQLPTTDESGNLASDGGETFKAIARLRAGVAIALAVSPPVLAHGERFGMRLAWGGFDGANAMGVSVMGVLAENTFSTHDRLALDGGVGYGFGDFMGYRENAVLGAHAGMQFTW
jgi:YadA head domain repeat (2 copies)